MTTVKDKLLLLFFIVFTVFLGCMTTSVCQHPCLPCLPWDPVWLSDLVPPPTPPGTDAAETELTPKAPEPTPLVHPQPSVSNMDGLNSKISIRCCAFIPFSCL